MADSFFMELDSAGNYVWAKTIGSVNYDQDEGMFMSNDGTLYNCGVLGGTADLDPGAGTFSMPASVCGTIYIQKLKPANVWPGDANHDNIVDNTDLLPIGLFYGQSGPIRDSVSNLWQGYESTDWSAFQSNGADLKHNDCNGDGLIDDNDTLAVNLNFSMTHSFIPSSSEERVVASDLFLVASSSTYTPGSAVNIEVWAGSAALPVVNLYGLAFTINYTASFVLPSTEQLIYPSSWLASPGIDGIKLGVADATNSKMYGAITRTDHASSNGYGKIADFKFQLKSSVASGTLAHFTIAGYAANDENGAPISFSTDSDSILITSSAGIPEGSNEASISVYPNPVLESFKVSTSKAISGGRIEILSTLGEVVYSEEMTGSEKKIDFKNRNSGMYFVRLIAGGKTINVQKIFKL